jgi:4-hydroxyphenylpyruvate dioxygenase-like putative hemolysin
LGFSCDNVRRIYEAYQTKHPKLIACFSKDTLEVFAYYQKHNDDCATKQADVGTLLRFVSRKNNTTFGLTPCNATFASDAQPAYPDHWVSNVYSRTEFVDTLADTLGFVPKVDFNAGVVAAGEAQIESTVTGNDASTNDNDAEPTSQVYLPINNALTQVGHVHAFLQEIGQGIQHVASRVDDLVAFVQAANDKRQLLGEGFTFLNIPRSYYGVVAARDISSAGVTSDCAEAIVQVLRARCILELDGALELNVTRNTVCDILKRDLVNDDLTEFERHQEKVLDVLFRSRYKNLYSLLRDHLTETMYLGIVRNKILVDVQGEDLLYQIFTANILQRNPGEEAPFFEFIQRVCSPGKVLRPGCGGFGE